MKPSTLLPLLLSVPSALCKSHGNSTSTSSQCRQLSHLQALVSLSSNATALAKDTHNDTAKATAIQAEASKAATTLATLETNSTLVTLCDQLFAVQAAVSSCRQLSKLEKTAAQAANATAATDKVKAKAAAQAGELAALQGNATLTTFCAGLKTKETCEEMASLQKVVDKAGTEGKNGTKTQGRVERAQTKLQELKGNATLVAACGQLGVEANNAQAAAAPGKSTSDAPVQFWSTSSTIALVSVFMSAILLL